MAEKMKAELDAGILTETPTPARTPKKDKATPVKNEDAEGNFNTPTPDPTKKKGIARKVDSGKKRAATGVISGRISKKNTPIKQKLENDAESDYKPMSGSELRVGELSEGEVEGEVKDEHEDNDPFMDCYGGQQIL
jgi:hypothetical protein